jgi:hypothetical protein
MHQCCYKIAASVQNKNQSLSASADHHPIGFTAGVKIANPLMPRFFQLRH